jgi:hypothetical protein
MAPSRAIKTASDRVWDLVGVSVFRIVVDPAQMSLALNSGFVGDDDAIDIISSNTFTIRDSDGATRSVDPRNVSKPATRLGGPLGPPRRSRGVFRPGI